MLRKLETMPRKCSLYQKKINKLAHLKQSRNFSHKQDNAKYLHDIYTQELYLRCYSLSLH